VPTLVKIGSAVLDKQSKMLESNKQTERHSTPTDHGRSEKLTSAFSSGELKINVNESQ
jgi:hypothetical protein